MRRLISAVQKWVGSRWLAGHRLIDRIEKMEQAEVE